jgi:hypothetical protein
LVQLGLDLQYPGFGLNQAGPRIVDVHQRLPILHRSLLILLSPFAM